MVAFQGVILRVSRLATIDSILPIGATTRVNGEKCKGTDEVLANDPFLKLYNAERGHVRCELRHGVRVASDSLQLGSGVLSGTSGRGSASLPSGLLSRLRCGRVTGQTDSGPRGSLGS